MKCWHNHLKRNKNVIYGNCIQKHTYAIHIHTDTLHIQTPYIYDVCICIGDVVISAPLSYRTDSNWILWGLLQIYNILSSSSQHLHLNWLHIYYTFTTSHLHNDSMSTTHDNYTLTTYSYFSLFFSPFN